MFRKPVLIVIAIFIFSPSLFAAEPYKGFAMEFNPGLFFTIGGNKSNSNSEPYVNLLFGYSFGKSSMTGLSLSSSMVSNNAVEKKTGDYDKDRVNYDNFELLSINLAYQYKIGIGEELYIPLKVFGGGTIASPTPNNKGTFLPDFGVATGVGYDSYRKGLQLGLEFAFSYILNINAKAIMVYPSIKYVF
ncbi:MAG: adventurous gliding motility protein CglE [Myxococcota bacterium]